MFSLSLVCGFKKAKNAISHLPSSLQVCPARSYVKSSTNRLFNITASIFITTNTHEQSTYYNSESNGTEILKSVCAEQVPCFYRVIDSQLEVWENEKSVGARAVASVSIVVAVIT